LKESSASRLIQMTEQDHQHRPPKREFDRHSGTGRPIKGENKRQGSGAGNWGSEQEVVQQGVEEFNANQDKNQKGKPQNQADLNDLDKENDQKTSYEDFIKESNVQQLATAYNTKTVESQFKKNKRLNKSERETDLLFAGDQKDKKKRNKKKKTKQLLVTSFTYEESANDQGGNDRGQGRGRGRNDNNFNQGFFKQRGGFGSRGRGRRNENFDDNNNNNNDINNNNNNTNDNNDQSNTNQNDNQNFSQPSNAQPKQYYRKKESSQTTTDNNTNQAPPQSTEQSNQQSSNQ